MRFKLRPFGNSVGIIFPAFLLKKYNLHIGDDLIGNETDESITLVISQLKKYTLRALVAQSKSQKLTEEDKEWLSIDDIGEEIVWHDSTHRKG